VGSRGALGAIAALFPVAAALGAPGGSRGLAAALTLALASVAPGLALLSVARPAGDASRAALLSVALSPVVLAAATALLVFGLGLELPRAAQLAWWGSGAALLAAALRRRGAAPPGPPAEPLLPALGPALLAAGLGAWLLAPAGARFSYHGYLHGGIAAQILSGGIPPDDVSVAGEPLGYYWLYHWLLAVLGELSGLSILVTAPLLDLLAAAVHVGFAYRLVRRFLAPAAASLAALAAPCAASLFFGAAFAAGWAVRGWPEGFVFWPVSIHKLAWLGGDPRLLTVLAKFLNVSAFPLGLALWALLLDELAPDGGRRPSPALVLAALSGLVLFHAATALAVFPALALARLAQGPLAPSPRRILVEHGALAATFVAALALTAPYLAATVGASRAAGTLLSLRPGELLYNARGILAQATPLLAILPAGLLRARRDPALRFLWVAAALPLALGLVLSLQDRNQYKCVLVASLPAGALLCGLLGPGLRERCRAARALFAATLCLAAASYAATALGYLESAFRWRRDVAGDGPYLALPADPAQEAALRWLRERTSPEAVAVTPPVHFNRSPVAAVSGRAGFVQTGRIGARAGPELAPRLALAQRLFDPREPAAPLLGRLAAALERPLYLLVARSQLPDEYPALVERFDALSDALEPVFRRPDAVVYAVRRRAVRPRPRGGRPRWRREPQLWKTAPVTWPAPAPRSRSSSRSTTPPPPSRSSCAASSRCSPRAAPASR
jgi:hypothetical protein